MRYALGELWIDLWQYKRTRRESCLFDLNCSAVVRFLVQQVGQQDCLMQSRSPVAPDSIRKIVQRACHFWLKVGVNSNYLRSHKYLHLYVRTIQLACRVRNGAGLASPHDPNASSYSPNHRLTSSLSAGTDRIASAPLCLRRDIPGVRRRRAAAAAQGQRHHFPVEEIARLAGHASIRTTEAVYRRELRPVITTGAQIMDQIFPAS